VETRGLCGVTHHFNKVLFVFSGSVELLEMELPGHRYVAPHLERIKTSVAKMAYLTAKLDVEIGQGIGPARHLRPGKDASVKDPLAHAYPIVS
jgi:hypothetical protein